MDPQTYADPLPALDSMAFRYVELAADDCWRCAVRDRGVGTVLAEVRLGGAVWGYQVQLDGAARPERVLPADLRRDRGLTIPARIIPLFGERALVVALPGSCRLPGSSP